MTLRKPPHVLIAGGGSLGAIYPAISIANGLAEELGAVDVTIAGDGRAIERHTVRSAGYKYATFPQQGEPRRLTEVGSYLARNTAGWCVSQWLLREEETSLVISIGGSASGAAIRAARSLHVPYLLVEANSLPHPATRSLAPRAHGVGVAFDETAAHLPPGSRVETTGGVVRPCFLKSFGDDHQRATVLRSRREVDPRYYPGRPRLVVLGGVGGATTLNEAAPEALSRLGAAAAGWQIVHQSGAGWLTETERRYREAGLGAIVVSYIDELADLASESDLFVCRPGGSMLAELALAGLPAVVVPDSRRRDNLHEANARLASRRFGFGVVTEGDALAEDLAAGLDHFIRDAETRRQAASRAAAAATPRATDAVVRMACEALGVAEPTRPLLLNAA